MWYPVFYSPFSYSNHSRDQIVVVRFNDAPEGFAGRPGDFIELEITEAHEYDLVARVV